MKQKHFLKLLLISEHKLAFIGGSGANPREKKIAKRKGATDPPKYSQEGGCVC